MNDQAAKLRSLVGNNYKEGKRENLFDKRAEILSISSGKGGVGKSNLTLNLAIALSKLGKNVCIIDADIGLSNIEIIAGVDSHFNLADVIEERKKMEEIINEIPGGVGLVSGGSGLNSLKTLSKEENIDLILKEIQKLQDIYDIILIDTGAGIGDQVMNFINMSDSLIVISTPEPTSLMDAYVLIKASHLSGFNGKIYYVANMVKNSKESDFLYKKISDSVNNFLSIEIDALGYIPKSELIVRAIRQRVPFMILESNNEVAKRIDDMARFLITHEKKEKISLSVRIRSLFFNRGG